MTYHQMIPLSDWWRRLGERRIVRKAERALKREPRVRFTGTDRTPLHTSLSGASSAGEPQTFLSWGCE